MKKIFTIDGVQIGEGARPYLIAELSANHNGSIDTAVNAIKLAKESGASAVKLQTYTAESMTIDCGLNDFMIKEGLWKGYRLFDLYQEAKTPYEWHHELFECAKKNNISIFSTPFDDTAISLLESLDAPAYKIASFEITDLPLVKSVASTGKPIILSTGMASFEEIAEAVSVIKSAGCEELVLLHCVSSYPAPIEEMNLKRIQLLRKKFNVPIGLSDHSIGNTAALTAAAIGACVIEKHFKTANDVRGLDDEFSISPQELSVLAEELFRSWQSLGSGSLKVAKSEEGNKAFRRSIYFVRNLKKGSKITSKDIKIIRPGFGLAPKYFDEIIGRIVCKDVFLGEPVVWEVLFEA